MSNYIYERIGLGKVLPAIQNKYPISTHIAFLSNIGTTIGYGLGGAGLIYEGLQGLKHHKTGHRSTPQETLTNDTIPSSAFSTLVSTPPETALPSPLDSFSPNSTPGSTRLHANFYNQVFQNPQHVFNAMPFQATSANPWPTFGFGGGSLEEVDSNKEGVHTLRPKTKWGKLGLEFGRIFGVGLAQSSGIFNGISMRFPLLSFGDGLALLSVPYIHKPFGMGLFQIGMASIFACRAMEQDERFKIDMNIWHQKKGFKDKSIYVLKNMASCIGEMLNSTKTILINLANLFGNEKKRHNANYFFKNEFFPLKPRFVLLAEQLTSTGKSYVQPIMKATPHFLHASSLLVGIGGIILTVGSLINDRMTKIIGYRTTNVGGTMDNIAYFKQGFEKTAFGNPASGISANIAGLVLLAGQGFQDTLLGRGVFWVGISSLFMAFALDQRTFLRTALSKRKNPLWSQANAMIRRWELNPLPVLGKQNGAALTQLNKVMLAYQAGPEAFAAEMKALEAVSPKLAKALDTVISHLNNKAYNANDKVVMAELNKQLKPTGLSVSINLPGEPLQSTISEVKAANKRMFGTEVI